MAHDQVADVAVGHIGHHGGVDSDNMGSCTAQASAGEHPFHATRGS